MCCYYVRDKDTVTKKMLKKMRNASCEYIGFDMESGSPFTLEFKKKEIQSKDFMETF